MPIPSSTYTEIVTTTLDNYRSKLADNVLNHNPLLARLKRKGNATNVGGGVKILENLMYALLSNTARCTFQHGLQ